MAVKKTSGVRPSAPSRSDVYSNDGRCAGYNWDLTKVRTQEEWMVVCAALLMDLREELGKFKAYIYSSLGEGVASVFSLLKTLEQSATALARDSRESVGTMQLLLQTWDELEQWQKLKADRVEVLGSQFKDLADRLITILVEQRERKRVAGVPKSPSKEGARR